MRSFFILSSVLAGSASLASAFPGRTRTARGAPSQEVEMVAAAWYTGWHAEDFTLDDVSWDKYTHMTYAFKLVIAIYQSIRH